MDDLNEDCLMEVLDKFEHDELIDIADTNCRFRELITQRYMIPKLHIHEYIIDIYDHPRKSENFDIYSRFN